MFATIGALRNASDDEIAVRFIRAYSENADLAMKILFFARDIRGGLGERRVFRTILKWLGNFQQASAKKNIKYIAEFGRYDDVLSLIGTASETEALLFVENQLKLDIDNMKKGKNVSLLAKWLPSINASSSKTRHIATKIAKFLKMNLKEYRKTLSELREHIKIIENNLRERDYTFDYEKQPSKAMLKYREAFLRNDNEKYTDFLNHVNKGRAKINTSTLTPYDIIAPFFDRTYGVKDVSEETLASIDATWNSQENFTNDENSLVVLDTSGSMYWGSNVVPASVAMSLGIYFAERNTGVFKNNFIVFSHTPQLVEIKGENIFEKLKYIEMYNEIADTNVQKVFELILDAAVKNNIPQKELPTTLYFISDMEFNQCSEGAELTNFEYAKKLFNEAGYQLPNIVFWNVDSMNRQQPVTKNEQGVTLVSGCSPRIFSMIKNKNLSPYDFMLETLESDRYKNIVA